MQTVLPTEIKTVNQAKAFLAALYFNGESYHPEDDAYHVAWVGMMEPTDEEKTKLNELMGDIYCLPDNGKYPNLIFDPCEFLNQLTQLDATGNILDNADRVVIQIEGGKLTGWRSKNPNTQLICYMADDGTATPVEQLTDDQSINDILG